MPPDNSDGRFDDTPSQMHQVEAFVDALADLLLGDLRMAPQRKGDVLEDRHRVEQRAFLKRHPEPAAEAIQIHRLHRADVLAVDDDVSAVRLASIR